MFKVLDEVCKPTKGSKYSACIDLYAREDVVIGAGETVKVPLGVCIEIEHIYTMVTSEYENMINYEKAQSDFKKFMQSHYLALHPRSSLRVKGLIANTGIIDLDYRDEIMMVVHNPLRFSERFISEGVATKDVNESTRYVIKKGDKVAQVMLCQHFTPLMGVDTEEERTGGFGSTGEK